MACVMVMAQLDVIMPVEVSFQIVMVLALVDVMQVKIVKAHVVVQ